MTNTPHDVSRRTLLTRAAVIGAAASLPASLLLSSPAYAADRDVDPKRLEEAIRRLKERNKRVLTGKPSLNGWEMEKTADDHGHVYTRPVPGTPLKGVRTRMGEVETVLVHVIRRFHYEIDELREGDVVGWRSPGEVRKGLPESNQASGTAVQIRPGHYPAGSRGGFFAGQQLVIRDVLAELEGVVRWGGDDRKPDEALFYLDVGPGDERLAAVEAKLRSWAGEPDRGAGTPVDVLDGDRRKKAGALASRQRQS